MFVSIRDKQTQGAMIAFGRLVHPLLEYRGSLGQCPFFFAVVDLDFLLECLLERTWGVHAVREVLRFATLGVAADAGRPLPVWQTTPTNFVFAGFCRSQSIRLIGAFTLCIERGVT